MVICTRLKLGGLLFFYFCFGRKDGSPIISGAEIREIGGEKFWGGGGEGGKQPDFAACGEEIWVFSVVWSGIFPARRLRSSRTCRISRAFLWHFVEFPEK